MEKADSQEDVTEEKQGKQEEQEPEEGRTSKDDVADREKAEVVEGEVSRATLVQSESSRYDVVSWLFLSCSFSCPWSSEVSKYHCHSGATSDHMSSSLSQ